MADSPQSSASKAHPVLVLCGIPIILFTAVLAGRMIWEETWLTLHEGPQMIGFSLAHGAGALLFLAPLLLLVWGIIALVVICVSLARKRAITRSFWSVFGTAVLMFGILSVPPVFWQWFFMGEFAKSPHAADLMTYAAAEGHLKTVAGYLSHGVPIEAKDYEGSTAAYNAAAAGRANVLKALVSKGANIDAVNDYGDSPLEAATKNHHAEAMEYLKEKGATAIRGTEEQRDAASKAIVQREIRSLHEE